jgi:integrase
VPLFSIRDRILRSFEKWLIEEYEGISELKYLYRKIKPKKGEKKEVEPFSLEEIEKILKAFRGNIEYVFYLIAY